MPDSLLPTYLDVETLKSTASMKKASFLNAKNAWSDEAVISAAQGTPGSVSNLTRYENDMITAINWYEDQNNAAQTALKSASSNSSDYALLFNNQKEALEALRQKVETERELNKVRQEQVAALEARDEANYHTSWMGLTRPLKEESRTGLLVAAGFFVVLALCCISYISYIIRINYQGSSGFSLSGLFRGVGGSGFRRGRYSN